MSFYIVTYYLPSGLFVMVSWISFLVNPDVIPGSINVSRTNNYCVSGFCFCKIEAWSKTEENVLKIQGEGPWSFFVRVHDVVKMGAIFVFDEKVLGGPSLVSSPSMNMVKTTCLNGWLCFTDEF